MVHMVHMVHGVNLRNDTQGGPKARMLLSHLYSAASQEFKQNSYWSSFPDIVLFLTFREIAKEIIFMEKEIEKQL